MSLVSKSAPPEIPLYSPPPAPGAVGPSRGSGVYTGVTLPGLTERLFDAARSNQGALCLELARAGAPVNARGVNGLTALHLCGVTDAAEAARALISAGADVNARDELNRTPLHASALACAFNVSHALLEASANPHARDERGKTPLGSASWNGDAACALLLLSYGSDPNAQDCQGRAPLHQALLSGNNSLETAWALIERGADPFLKDGTRASALDYAKKLANPAMLGLLTNEPSESLMGVKLAIRRVRQERKIAGSSVKRRRGA